MKLKKLSLLAGAALVTVGLVGCSSGAQLPEGDVKVVKQEVQGVIGLLLESADYGANQTTVASMLLPKDAQYNINVVMEEYVDGTLTNTKELANHTTQMIKKDSIIHMIMNAGNTEESRSIFSIGEVDEEKTTNPKSPEFKMEKTYEPGFNYDLKSDITTLGKALDEEFAISAYVKFKENDVEKMAINLDTYADEVGNYASVYVLKAKVSAK
ncbi:MAG: hypothetical protein ACRCST_15980 [Turicibacter sp.]